ncbi:uncharacterized protein BDZ99DRAFT_525796 [Mytilinidion resinicola]|uniref:Uncharacterized protein n=1 Tax=Mytilinidion resinicola TaxID=574789 RepID=A0A6A6Y8B0_9PEZI|nr:uncharacterized protein BDZ99DRAFT_525796 [Mytilinidion resinicola]KAF2804204.1 hypothetical protein BDZ99DRAFT_525796 [Mytilinidion resinicola]
MTPTKRVHSLSVSGPTHDEKRQKRSLGLHFRPLGERHGYRGHAKRPVSFSQRMKVKTKRTPLSLLVILTPRSVTQQRHSPPTGVSFGGCGRSYDKVSMMEDAKKIREGLMPFAPPGVNALVFLLPEVTLTPQPGANIYPQLGSQYAAFEHQMPATTLLTQLATYSEMIALRFYGTRRPNRHRHKDGVYPCHRISIGIIWQMSLTPGFEPMSSWSWEFNDWELKGTSRRDIDDKDQAPEETAISDLNDAIPALLETIQTDMTWSCSKTPKEASEKCLEEVVRMKALFEKMRCENFPGNWKKILGFP